MEYTDRNGLRKVGYPHPERGWSKESREFYDELCRRSTQRGIRAARHEWERFLAHRLVDELKKELNVHWRVSISPETVYLSFMVYTLKDHVCTDECRFEPKRRPRSAGPADSALAGRPRPPPVNVGGSNWPYAQPGPYSEPYGGPYGAPYEGPYGGGSASPMGSSPGGLKPRPPSSTILSPTPRAAVASPTTEVASPTSAFASPRVSIASPTSAFASPTTGNVPASFCWAPERPAAKRQRTGEP